MFTPTPTTHTPTGEPVRIGIYYDQSFWNHLYFYWLNTHPAHRRIDLRGVHDLTRWYAHKKYDVPISQTVITDACFIKAESNPPKTFDGILDSLKIKRHHVRSKPNGKSIGFSVELACTCLEAAYAYDLHLILLVTGGDDYIPLIERLTEDNKTVLIPGINAGYNENRTGRRGRLATSPHLRRAATDSPTWQEFIDMSLDPGYDLTNPLFRESRDTSHHKAIRHHTSGATDT